MLSIDQYAHTNKLAEINANQKIIFSICALLCVWLTRNFSVSLWTFFFMSFQIVYKARIPLRYYLLLLFAPAGFCLLGVLSIVVSFTTVSTLPDGVVWSGSIYHIKVFIVYSSIIQALELIYNVFGTIACLYFCMLTTPMHEISHLLRRLHVPEILIELMTLTYHFIFIFLDCMQKIYTAQRNRLGYQSLKSSFVSTSLLMVALVREVFHRNDQMILAMKARNIETFLIPYAFYKKKAVSTKLLWITGTYFIVTLVLWIC